MLVQELLVGDVMDGEQLDSGDAEVLEVGHHLVARQSGIGALQLRRESWQLLR